MKRLLALVTFLLVLSDIPCLLGQNQPDKIDLAQFSLEDLFNAIVVSAVRHEQKSIDSPRSVSVVTAKDLANRNYRTVPEALNDVAGILVQETNYGGGSPIIRGLMGNQILILVDGVRVNNAIYRYGPNQYLNTIDITQVERIEIVHGPGSVLYGSDGMGGMIQIFTKTAEGSTQSSEIAGRIFWRFASADRSQVGRFEFRGNARRLGFIGGVSLKNFGDLRGGNRTGLQSFTGYGEQNADLKISYRLSENRNLTMGLQRVDQKDVPRSDLLASGADLKYEWDPERRELGYLQYSQKSPGRIIKTLSAIVSYQDHYEHYRRILSAAPTVERHFRDEVGSIGLSLQLGSSLGRRQTLTYGAEYHGDRVDSSRVDANLTSGALSPKKGTFSDGSTFKSFALFLQDEISVTEALNLNVGVRYNIFRLKAITDDPAVGQIPVRLNPHSSTVSVHALYRLKENLNLILGAAQGFRAPNADDSTFLGSFSGGYEIPNPQILPEKSWNYEAGIKTQQNRFSTSLFYFISRHRDLIERQPSTFNGLSFLDLNANGILDRGETGIFQKQNAGRAMIQGIEAKGQATLAPDWTFYTNLGWTHGEDLLSGNALRRIPPLKGNIGLQWTLGQRLWLESYSVFAGRQNRLAPGDLTDPRISPTGTPGFATLNFRGGADLKSFGQITVGIENVANKSYRLHGSGIDSPGRSFVVSYSQSLRHAF